MKYVFLIKKKAYHCKGWKKTNFLFLLALQLAICIEKKHQSIEEFQDCLGSQDPDSPRAEVTTLIFSYSYFNAINFLPCPSCSLLLTKLPNWQEDGPVSEDFSVMQTPGENFDGKCDR